MGAAGTANGHHDYYVGFNASAIGEQTAAGVARPGGPDGAVGRAPAPAHDLVITSRPMTYGVPTSACILGILGLWLAIVFPLAWMLCALLCGGAVAAGTSGLRRAVQRGAAGMWLSVVGGALGLVGLVVTAVAWTGTVRAATGGVAQLGGLIGSMQTLEVEADVWTLDLVGSGTGTVVLDGEALPFAWDACGLQAPAPGYSAAAFATAEDGRTFDVTIARRTIGEEVDHVAVTLGSDVYVLSGPAVLQLDGNGGVHAAGEFTVPLGAPVEGSVTATCTR